MNIETAKAIPISKILETLNLKPQRAFRGDEWYLSPFRLENKASFHVSTQKNVWYDFGEAIGGDGINLVQEVLKRQNLSHSTRDALAWLKSSIQGNVIPFPIKREALPKIDEGPRYLVEFTTPINNPFLVDYLAKRGIPLSVAETILLQALVFNKNTKKKFTALALPTERCGYEITTPYIKGSVGTKSISFIRGKKPKPPGIHFFEGMMDYLSVITQLEGRKLQDDAIILNSVNNVPQVLAYLYQYDYSVGYTWMDNDEAGRKATQSLQQLFKHDSCTMAHTPMNDLYAPFKDVNAWHMQKLEL